MHSPLGITASAFRMKCFKLLFITALSAIILTGCERQLLPPVDPMDPPQTDTQFAQMALSDLANTATSQGFINLADAANGFVEALATEDQTYVQPTFSKLDRLVSEVTYLESSFANAGCSIELRTFAEASVDAIRGYTIRDAVDMERALQNLAQEAGTASIALQQLSTLNNTFRPFVFGYSAFYYWSGGGYELGRIALQYENIDVGRYETADAVVQFLNSKGYRANPTYFGDLAHAYIELNADVNPYFIIEEFGEELEYIPNVASVGLSWYPVEHRPLIVELPPVYTLNSIITNSISDKYNKAWCQGHLDVNAIDSILIEESRLDFFNYAFLRNLVDIYAEEKSETTERIRSNMFSFRSIALKFLRLYFQSSGKTEDELIEMYPQYQMESYEPLNVDGNPFRAPERTLNEIIELFRQSVKRGNVHIEADKAPSHYYHWHWK